MSLQARDSYDNLVLLCLEHHAVIDDDPGTWTVEKLHRIKRAHELMVEAAMSPYDTTRAEQELLYAAIIDQWAEKSRLDDWDVWTSWLLTPRPNFPRDVITGLDHLVDWIFRRPWSGALPAIDEAVENFRRVAEDLVMVLRLSEDPDSGEEYWIDAFYKKQWVEQHEYHRMVAEFDWICALIHDLVIELTRAGELVIESVRRQLDSMFRWEEGRLTVSRQGPGFFFERLRPSYPPGETSQPYPGLREFLTIRAERDVFVGNGVNEAAYRRVTPITLGEPPLGPGESGP